MMRILHVIGSMNRGGAETMIMNLYRYIDREKIQFDFVENCSTSSAFDAEIISLGGRIFRCPHYDGKNHFQYIKWWNGFFREHNGEYQIIHGHLGSTAAIYLKIAKKYGLFTVAHSHSTQTQISVSEFLYKIYSFPTRWIADQFFTCSRDAGVSRYGYKIGCDITRCIKLNNAIDTNNFVFDPFIRDKVRNALCFKDKIVIGHVGRFNKEKNHVFLIKIFNEIHKINTNTRLLLVGDGQLRSQVNSLLNDYNIVDSVYFTGVVDNVADYYQAMDVFVFPSLYEGLPVSLVEAQTADLPCFISDKVPSESILLPDLVTVCNLSDSAETWAKHILSQVNHIRKDRTQEIAAVGYDITETSKWLGEFYLEKCR